MHITAAAIVSDFEKGGFGWGEGRGGGGGAALMSQ